MDTVAAIVMARRRWSRGRSRGRGHLVYTGSTSVYAQDGGVEVEESQPALAADARSEILRETETALAAWPGPWTILRLAGIYGPGRHHLLDGLRDGRDTVAGHGGHHLNLIHRDDIAAAILTAWARPEVATRQVYNVVDDGRATKGEVVDWLAGEVGVSPPVFTGVAAPGRRLHQPDRIICNDHIKRELGWAPRYPTFREGYRAILEA